MASEKLTGSIEAAAERFPQELLLIQGDLGGGYPHPFLYLGPPVCPPGTETDISLLLRRIREDWQGKGSRLAWGARGADGNFVDFSTNRVPPERCENITFCQRHDTSQKHGCLIFHWMLKKGHLATCRVSAVPILRSSTWKRWRGARLHSHICTNCSQQQKAPEFPRCCRTLLLLIFKRCQGQFPSNSQWWLKGRRAVKPHQASAASATTLDAKLYSCPML